MMKRVIALLLALAMLLIGCGQKLADDTPAVTPMATAGQDSDRTDASSGKEANLADEAVTLQDISEPEPPQFTGLDDPTLHEYVEDAVYKELVDQLDSEDYFVENVSTVYLSKEYLEEIEFNSQTNVFFGYSLADLDAQFEGSRYVFTLAENGETTVKPFEEYDDDTFEQVIKNVAVGSGVILVCVTVSVVTDGIGASAISMIFATSAKTGAIYALSCGSVGATSAGIVTGIQTGDFEQAMKAAALAGSEEFKWGAFTGAINGAISAGVDEVTALQRATLNGLTKKEAAAIQKEGLYDLDVIENLHSKDEYELYKDAGLYDGRVNGKHALLQKIEWNVIRDAEDGRTNAERIDAGLAPLDPTGNPYELHHIGQKEDSPLAILTSEQHRGKGNTSILHQSDVPGVDHGANWEKIKNDFWKAYYELTKEGV